MAGRKGRSSKTEHVLNLLAGSSVGTAPPGLAQDAAPAEETPAVQAAPTKGGDNAEAAAPSQDGHRMAAPILEVARANSEALEQTIRGALEEALEHELTEESSAEPGPEPKEELKAAPEPEPAPAEPAPEPEAAEPVSAETVPEPAAAEETPEPAAPPAAESASAPEPPAVLPDDMVCVNVMWELVEEKAERYIRMFGLCGCPRCVADVKALALTKLPAKYVVLKESARRPMISLYRAKFDAPVTAQLLSACKQVMDEPRHGDLEKN